MFEDVKIAIIIWFGTIQECLKRGLQKVICKNIIRNFLIMQKFLKNKGIGNYFFNMKSALNDAIKFDDNEKISEIQKFVKLN